MATRIASAAVGLPLIVLAVWLGGYWFTALVLVAAAIASTEASHMAKRWGGRSFTPIVVVLATALIVYGHFLSPSAGQSQIWAVIITAGSLLATAWMVFNIRLGNPALVFLTNFSVILYPAGFLFLAPLLRSLEQGREWVLLMLLVTFATDTAAFLVGHAVGKHPLSPTISPSKTIEGALGGVVGAVLAAAAVRYVFSLDASLIQVLALGGLIGVIGQIGDLVESRLKRIAGVKDSGRVIPGHGGILDRLDSIVFNLVVVYYFVIWVIQ